MNGVKFHMSLWKSERRSQRVDSEEDFIEVFSDNA